MPSRIRRSCRLSGVVLAMLLAFGTGIIAQPSQNKAVRPADDADFAKSVSEWTTRPDFISPLVDHLPKAAGIPSPKDVLGHHIGEPKKLTYYADILSYYRALAAKTPRVKIVSIGKSNEGRDLVVVFVGSDESIKNLDQYRTYLAQLADPRTISPEQAKQIVAKAKPIYHLMGGLHSGEVGPSEMLMELAYRLVTEDSPIVNAIRDNVIVSITPVADPDGRDRNVDWYYRYGINETEGRGTAGVPYWGKYVFHDDNRDINYSQVEMRALLEWYLQWHPPIMHDLHQAQTLLYTFSGQAPQNPNLDPILYGELPMMANFEMAQFAKYGMPGVWTHGFVDMWSPGYLAFMSSNHNGMIRMYEIQGTSGANTTKMRLGNPNEPAGRGRGAAAPAAPANPFGNQAQREWYRPWPATGEFDWSLRDNTNYGETGVLTALQYTSQFPKIILENFYIKSRNSVDSGRKETVAGYVIPAGQRDMTRVERLVNLLRMQGIEIGRATAEVKLQEGTFPAGSFVIKRDQPYGRLAKILLEKQNYPDPSLRTYDDASWTMGMMSHAEVKEIDDKKVLDAAVDPVQEKEIHIAGRDHRHRTRHCRRALRLEQHDHASLPPEGFQGAGGRKRVQARGRRRSPPVPSSSAATPRKSEAPSTRSASRPWRCRPRRRCRCTTSICRASRCTASGATRRTSAGCATRSTSSKCRTISFTRSAFVKATSNRRTTSIIVPNQAGSGKRMVFDIENRGEPIEYKRTDKFKNLGMYGESDDITGGMGVEGVAEFEKFVKSGGVLVTLGTASFFPADFGLAPRIDAARTSGQFYSPGAIIDAEILQPESPIFYGYDKKTIPVRYANGPLLAVQTNTNPFDAPPPGPPPTPPGVLMRYPGGDDHVLSGLMRGANEIRNRPAIVDEPNGKGRVILFAGNPCYRWQNFGEFNMLFNTVLNYNDIKTETPKATPPTSAGK